MATVVTMQDALLALTNYWTERGAMIVQPFNTEVGAGTYNPATILRVLGPEPWRVAYVEPSVRPDDARYGENPNRLQTHTQFQVILKPDPGDPQEVYLGSLGALGIDVDAHDIRFVEDNWASPALGAWGLGWEVWLDGLEITQFTYFQQAGGKNLDPVSVEITYGIERILMALQGVGHFKDIAYAPGISYGEVFGQSEYEMSRYYLDDADVATNWRLFEDYEGEARRCITERLPVPAHNFVLKCSHVFNVLDSRGAISTTERANAFGRMRSLARQVATLWAERREELGNPLGLVEPPPLAQAPAEDSAYPTIDEPSTLLFELGTEELPHAEVRRTAEAVREGLTSRLAGTRLTHGEVRTYATPRRVVAVVEAVAPHEPDAERTVRGPKVAAAYDADGNPTKAAQGFARGQGVDPADLTRIEQGGTEYVAAVRTDVGRPAARVLSELLGSLVADLRSDTNMRWSDPKLSFTRPIRWLLALLGEQAVPVAVSALASGTTTRVRRTAAEPVVTVPSADGYLDFLRRHEITASPDERRELVVAASQALAAQVGGVIDLEGEAALVEEIVNLVEHPVPLLGSFSADYLDLPAEILTTVMRKHQRYLPVRAADGTLLPHFVAVADGSCDADVVRAGNEAVLRARYEDAAFFWRADLEVPPEQHRAGLAKLAFESRLGSMAERADRISAVAGRLGELVSVSGDDATALARAGELTKFDLGSQMVVELTSLAGTMAREYAVRAGETEAVAAALYDMELPRAAGGPLPATRPGALLALADRLDLLAGLFAVGANPTGSSDPFALRRAALGVVSILRDRADLAAVTVERGLSLAAERIRAQGVEVPDKALADAGEFVVRRYEQQLLDAGHEYTQVQAVLPLAGTPALADQTLRELSRRTSDPAFADVVAALQRVRRIVPADVAGGYDPAALTEPEELALHQELGKVADALGTDYSLAEFADAVGGLVGPVNAFFDAVLVMADDPAVRAARLGLLASIRDLAAPVLDWDAL
ncbi:glycine--tRNA ligase [Actinopolymorpha cephalotaxi]|uniref:Multifunctional fusion protein n=1 Tax=Actinopolymorpha cephalotaxi TaxID=504797 RepID=A0ABX2S823_9ACTN|nr:glycine--tRNA ligase [Actinopolymorpha cephalotaxi]NYH85803.1 glycyl-tRNA synthetase [Actinopolymorpha cephalotaxi]